MKIVVGITGASGIVYAINLLKALKGKAEVHLIISDSAEHLLEVETDMSPGQLEGMASHIYNNHDFNQGLCSGSFLFDAMVIIPCTMSTLAKLSNGIADNVMTRAGAVALKESRFQNIRLAWDFGFGDQYKIKDAIELLKKAGYKNKDLMIFMICNWQISSEECCKKAYLCAVWNVKISDCYFDGQTSPNITPIGWTEYDIKTFRKGVRKHNQMVTFGIDPEVKRNKHQARMFD